MIGRQVSSWIFVTGAPRCGTTFVGSILSAPLSVDYIHEPFNPDCGLPSIDQRYLYLREDDDRLSKYLPDISALFQYRAKLQTGYYPRDTVLKRTFKSVVGSRGPFYYRLARLNPFHQTAVIKDPIGCLLAGFLQQRFGVRPLLLTRHPVTFVASVLRLGWQMTLEPFLTQRELIEDYLAAEESSLRSAGSDPIEVAAHIWRTLYTVLLRQAQQNDGWLVIRHEDLSNEPVEQFRKLYEDLGLPWSARVERRVNRWSRPGNAIEASKGRVQHFRRDSRQLHALRMAMLEPHERRRVYELTGELASHWYDEQSYGI
jgi:hypothetical protein